MIEYQETPRNYTDPIRIRQILSRELFRAHRNLLFRKLITLVYVLAMPIIFFSFSLSCYMHLCKTIYPNMIGLVSSPSSPTAYHLIIVAWCVTSTFFRSLHLCYWASWNFWDYLLRIRNFGNDIYKYKSN